MAPLPGPVRQNGGGWRVLVSDHDGVDARLAWRPIINCDRGPGLLLEAPASQGRVDGAPEGRDVGAPVLPERLPAPVPLPLHLRAGGHARVVQIQRPREALVVGPGADRYHRSPGRAVHDVSQRRAGADDDARRREELRALFHGKRGIQLDDARVGQRRVGAGE